MRRKAEPMIGCPARQMHRKMISNTWVAAAARVLYIVSAHRAVKTKANRACGCEVFPAVKEPSARTRVCFSFERGFSLFIDTPGVCVFVVWFFVRKVRFFGKIFIFFLIHDQCARKKLLNKKTFKSCIIVDHIVFLVNYNYHI